LPADRGEPSGSASERIGNGRGRSRPRGRSIGDRDPHRSADAPAREENKSDLHQPTHPVRFITAASLFDGHDAAINIMRGILQRQGAEVVHLGHNRSVDEVVAAAIQEDVQGVAISSYQGGHVEYFTYLVELLRERGAGHVKVFGGGGGVIVPKEIALLHSRRVSRIFSPEDGQRMGLLGMINLMIRECDVDLAARPPASFDGLLTGDPATLTRTLTLVEAEAAALSFLGLGDPDIGRPEWGAMLFSAQSVLSFRPQPGSVLFVAWITIANLVRRPFPSRVPSTSQQQGPTG
jgi:methylmalonyl-CoA mutase cobalamin-binding domain/chain